MSGLELLGWAWPEIGAAFALTAAALVVLYLVRLRRRVVTVPWIALFREALPDQRTTRFFTRLKNLLSLLLVLIVAALIALALGQPRIAEEEDEARTIVLVIDASASMQARVAGGDATTRFDRAKEAALALLADLGATDRAIVLAASAHAEVVHPMSSEHALLVQAVRALDPTDTPGDAREALAWAASLCARDEGADAPSTCDVEILTDGGLTSLAEARAELEARGVPSHVTLVTDAREDNLAITALSARRFPADPSRAELLVELTSFATETTPVTLSIVADGQLAHRERVELAAGRSVRRTLDELTGADALFEAQITRADNEGRDEATSDADASPPLDALSLDALSVDDVAWARLAPRRRRRAVLVAPPDAPNVYLEAALLLDPHLDVVTMTPEAYEASGAATDRELAIFDRYTPERAPRVPSIVLAPGTPTRDWLSVGEAIERPHFDTQDRDHDLLAFVALRDVNIGVARPILPAAGDEVVAGEARGALLTTGVRDGVRFVALGLDVRDSDLPLRIAWPILVLDAVAYLVPDDVTLAPSAETGRAFRLALSEPRATLVPRAPNGAPIELVPREGIAHLELGHRGVYDLALDGGEASGRTVVANLFSRSESRLEIEGESIEGARSLDLDAAARAVAARSRADDDAPRWPLHVLLVAAALLLLAVEWLTFHRRWTT